MQQLIRYLIWFLLLFAGYNSQAQNNTVYGAGISYTNGAPSWVPNPRTSRAAVDTVTGRWYHFNTPGGWQWIGNTVEEIAGCAAPAYTPSKGDSRLVINNCVKPQVYWYDGTVWKWINQGEVYTAGQGIRIESNTIILDSLYVLRFRTGSNTDGAAGTMSWNATEETLDLVTDQGAVTGHLMESAYYNTRNTTGTPITIGTVVMANGTTGNTGRILIAPAIANGTVNSEYILGLAAQTIGNNSNGKVQHFGKIRGIQTNGANYGETWVDGDVLYCSSATPGYLTKVLPTAPNLKVPIAIVIHAHPSNGTLFVRPSHFPDLAQINDVQLSSPTNGQVLTYNSTLSRWENATPANQLQTLSTDGSAGNISISSGNTITLNVNDADASTTNELQTLSLSGSDLSISGGNTVTLPATGLTGNGVSPFVAQYNSTNTLDTTGIVWNGGRMGVGLTTISPSARIEVRGIGSTSATNTAQFKNGTGTNIVTLTDDGSLLVGLTTPSSSITKFETNSRGRFHGGIELGATASARLDGNGNYYRFVGSANGFGFYNDFQYNPTSGTYYWAEFSTPVVVSSGSAAISVLRLRPVINLTGTATTNVIGLDYNPTLTSLASGRNIAALFRTGQVGIGTGTGTPDVSAALDVTSTTQGILFPRMTTTQRNAIATPADGLVIYNTTDNKLQVRAAGAWVDLH